MKGKAAHNQAITDAATHGEALTRPITEDEIDLAVAVLDEGVRVQEDASETDEPDVPAGPATSGSVILARRKRFGIESNITRGQSPLGFCTHDAMPALGLG